MDSEEHYLMLSYEGNALAGAVANLGQRAGIIIMQETKLPLKLHFPVKRSVDTNLNQESITTTILIVVLVIPNKIPSAKNRCKV